MKPIDYVVPMVFPDDAEWQEQWVQATGDVISSISLSPRWRSWETEELLIRCVLRFMPWVRYIHIILSGESQVQPWMKELDQRIQIVYHKDFIPEEYLPCFSSNTIEMFLKDIPKLSEQFIYGNDDIYPISPLSQSDFFRKGLPCQHHEEKPYIKNPYIRNTFLERCSKGLNMVASDFGKHFDGSYLFGGHSLSPILKSVCAKVWSKHKEEILQSIQTLRAGDTLNQYIYSYYQHLSGRYVDHTPTRNYVSLSNKIEDICIALSETSTQVICVNDNDDWVSNWKECREVVRKALESKLKEE